MTFGGKWIWIFTNFLINQVSVRIRWSRDENLVFEKLTISLKKIGSFLDRTEPEIDSITGEEKDTISFMKMMRLFNQISVEQEDMDARFGRHFWINFINFLINRFVVMKKTLVILEKYGEHPSDEIKELFKSSPNRWNHLKTKVSLAKQRLGPRIQVTIF